MRHKPANRLHELRKPALPGEPSPMRWYARVGLLLLGVLLLSLAQPPVSQCYFAWVGLVPWLFVVRSTRSWRGAFLWSWLGGTAFFLANMWWLWNVTVPGTFTLTAYLGLDWGFAAVIYCGCRLVPRSGAQPHAVGVAASVLLIGVVWTALEWVRGNWSMFGEQGLPWLYIGHSQSPLLTMCQVADIGSAYAVSLWVVMVNALVFWLVLYGRRALATLAPAIAVTTIVVLFVAGYGVYRLRQTRDVTSAGPTVLVIQPNYPQDNSGEKGAPLNEILRFHIEKSREALDALHKSGTRPDLIAWSETMMPPLNDEARKLLANTDYGRFLQESRQQIADLAAAGEVAIVAGGTFADDWQPRGERLVPLDRRNSAYYFERSGLLSERRYDKIHLVPFGEFIPFRSIKPLYELLIKLGPPYYEAYILTPGSRDNVTVFELASADGTGGYRFVVPICFEDIVSPLVAEMVRAPGGSGKRAEFLVNLTNDGWFTGGQMAQHLQSATFRSIENRAPTARAVNTGISAFIDSVGRVHDTVPAKTEGWSAARLTLDSRVTFYTRHGDVLAGACAIATLGLIVWSIIVAARRNGSAGGTTPAAPNP